MSNFNKVLLMGRLTRDPELRYTPQGTPVTEIGLAVNRRFTEKSGEKREDTTFVDVTLWSKQAELVCNYLRKGQPIFIEGRLSLSTWETQDGQRRSKLRVVGKNFQFVGGRGEGGAAGGPPSQAAAPQPEYEYQASQESGAGAGGGGGGGAGGGDGGGGGAEGVDDSEIPF